MNNKKIPFSRFGYKPYIDYEALLNLLEDAAKRGDKETANEIMRFVGGRIPFVSFVDYQRTQTRKRVYPNQKRKNGLFLK